MKHFKYSRRPGNVLVMAAFMMSMLVAFVALAVDVGYLYTMRNELQRTADAAAIAATWELIDEDKLEGISAESNLEVNARLRAAQYAALNRIGQVAPLLAEEDVVVGYMANPSDPNETIVPAGGGMLPNAVRVRVQRTAALNGEIPLFFARMLGVNKQAATAEATAALIHGFSGFRMPADGSNLAILPFALDETTWNNLCNGVGTDSWSYNPQNKTVYVGADGILECNLFPQGTGSPGNRGTVDIGSSNNSTADIRRQILHGINQSDFNSLIAQNRSLDLTNGPIQLNGDTGISAGVKDELTSIVGKPRIIPIFNAVVGPGNNAEYTIVKWVGVRVVEVKLTGSMKDKRVMIQPCNMIAKGGIPTQGASATDYVYSPVWLVR
jgi:hypothetical protein